MRHLNRILPAGAVLLACLCVSADLRADSVTVSIQNKAAGAWTLKAPTQANITVQIYPEGSATALASRTGSEANVLYYDLPGAKDYIMYINGREKSTKVDYQFNLGGSNRNYKIIRAYRDVPTSNFIANHDVKVVGNGYQKLTSAPMKTITGEDTIVVTALGSITIKADNYPR